MITPRTAWKLCGILTLALVASSVGVTAQKPDISAEKAAAANLPNLIWQDPGNVASLDMMYGAGGKANAPDPTGTFTFVREVQEGTSPKFDVTDGQGTKWRVKLGQESQCETAATRFLWAAGYFADEDYYLAELRVNGLPTLRRGQKFVSANGIVQGARLERKPADVTRVGHWDWFANPFLGQRELNGLRVMMALLNNWDLKRVNNSIDVVGGQRHYVVSDVGATFGRTGNRMKRSKGVPRDYEDSRFIARVTPDSVDFVLHSRPFFLSAVQVSAYRERVKMEEITKRIPRADARWVGQRLSMLTDDQIRDAFRAAGYGVDDVETLTRTIRKRIAALEAL